MSVAAGVRSSSGGAGGAGAGLCGAGVASETSVVPGESVVGSAALLSAGRPGLTGTTGVNFRRKRRFRRVTRPDPSILIAY